MAHDFVGNCQNALFRALEWLSSTSVAEIMDKKNKIGKNFCTHKPQSGVENTFFSKWLSLASGSRQRAVQIRSEWGKTCSLGWKKNFLPCDFGLSGYVYKTTGCFEMFLKTFHDVSVPWEFENRAESLAQPREI